MAIRTRFAVPVFSLVSLLGCAATSEDAPGDLGGDQSLATNASALRRCSVDLGTLGGASSEALGVRKGIVVGQSDTGEVDSVGLPIWHATLFRRNGKPLDLGTLGGNSSAFAISEDGVIVGTSMLASGDTHSFVYQHHHMTDIGTLGGAWAIAEAMSDDGTVVGSSLTSDGHVHAFRWRDGEMTDLGTLGGDDSAAHAIDGDVIVGDSTNAGTTRAFRMRDDAPMTELPSPAGFDFSTALSVKGPFAVGTGGAQTIEHALVWHHRHVIDLNQGDGASRGVAVNADGLVILNAFVSIHSFTTHPFAWKDGEFFDLTGPDAGGRAVAVNDDGVVAGNQRFGRGPNHAFAWKDGKLLLLPNIGGTTSWVNAIDARGNIVGAAATATGSDHAALWRHCED